MRLLELLGVRFLDERMQLGFTMKIGIVALVWSGTSKMIPSNLLQVPGKRSLRAAAAFVPPRGAATGTSSRPSEAPLQIEFWVLKGLKM